MHATVRPSQPCNGHRHRSVSDRSPRLRQSNRRIAGNRVGCMGNRAARPYLLPGKRPHNLCGRGTDLLLFNHRNVVIASVIARSPPSGMIVDVGGRNGYVSLGLQRAGFNSVVVEPGAQGARCASERGLPVIKAPFETLDIPRGTMPAAGLFDVLERIGNAAGALRGLHEGSRPGGMLYQTVPAFGWLWSSVDVQAGHYWRYSLTSLAQSVASAGFVIEYAAYFFSILVPPVLALRTVPTELGLTRSNMRTDTADDRRLTAGLIDVEISKTMAWEAGRIARGKTIALDSSCFLVAKRTNDRA